MIGFKGSQFGGESSCGAAEMWLSMSYRQLEEMLSERGWPSTILPQSRWVLKYAPEVENSSAAISARWDAAGVSTERT
jgi:transposase-like protein